MDVSGIRAVLFDYGNTLIEFGPRQVLELNTILLDLLRGWYGPCDAVRFAEIRHSQIIAPYETKEYIENDREGICVELVEKLHGETPDSARIAEMLDLKHRSFVAAVELPSFVVPFLEKLRARFALGLISNYPCRESVTDSLKKVGIFDFFDSIVVSGEIGVVKPHPTIFARSLEQLRLSPDECVYVGDNWLADIQGAKLAGMRAVHTTQYVSYENFQPFDGDLEPDAVIGHLEELEPLLLGG